LPRRVDLSPASIRDLDATKRWLLQPGSGEAARDKLRTIRQSIRQLERTPCRWAVGDHDGVREIPVGGYRVMYEVDADTGDNETAGNVRVLRVFGPHMSRQDL
jgi:plasmid stabilization system protein ParE